MYYAEIIADSISPRGHRATTMEVQFPRFVLAEFNTHRAFSRNSASSRAIPIKKQIAAIKENPVYPLVFGTAKPGMQAGPPLEPGTKEYRKALRWWNFSMSASLKAAAALDKVGVHKQVTNRILEPYMWHKVIVTSTDWENFFNQRCSSLAQPEIDKIACMMRDVLEVSSPRPLDYGQYHLPYVQRDELDLPIEFQIAISIARCARVSYLTHDKIVDRAKDFALFMRLVTETPPHYSPLEHVCTPVNLEGYIPAGNFYGWQQMRHLTSMTTQVQNIIAEELALEVTNGS